MAAMSNEPKLQTLKEKLQTVHDLRMAQQVLEWDQLTYMPPGGAEARGRQLATLGELAHQYFTAPEIGQLLDDLAPLEETLPFDSDDASLLRVVRKDYERAVRVPTDFVSRFTEHLTSSYQIWGQARANNDFQKVVPTLEKTLEFSQQFANFFDYDHIADPLIAGSDEGMTVALLRPLFAELRAGLIPLVKAISQAAPLSEAVLHQPFEESKQLNFGLKLASAFGYDLNRGRQDKTLHPFATNFSVNDVRITTRVKPDMLSEALFSTLHEAGHAMYEQGIDPGLEGTLLANGTSSGVHESQSRLWENLVGRSHTFWQYAYPQLQETFPEQFGKVDLKTFYQAINRVTPSLIRTDADEVTYNLHVIIRFELELELLEGKLAITDLAETWRGRYQDYLGVASETDSDGVLQDIHWYAGTIGGAFQGYTLGNILSAQYFEAAHSSLPDLPAQIAQGTFQPLHDWLKTNIYQHGRKFTASELTRRATGSELIVTPYLGYLRDKFSALYELKTP
jgi:carboxypeptidase Taq